MNPPRIPRIDDLLFLDTETTGLNPWAPSTRCRGIGYLDGATGTQDYIDFDDGDLSALEHLRHLLKERPVVAHNLHFDFAVLRRLGIELPPVEQWHCTLTLARLAAPRLPKHGLKPLCVQLFNESDDDEDQRLRQWAKENKVPVVQRYEKAPQELLSRYCMKDVYLLAKVYARFHAHLKKPEIYDAYRHEMAVLQRLIQAEERGQLLSLKHLKDVEVELSALADRQKQAIFGLAGRDININATAQVADVLYGNGLPARFTKNGRHSTSKGALAIVARSKEGSYQPGAQGIAKELLKLRQTLGFLKYCKGFRKYLRGPLLSCMFDALGAVTGRMSSSDPNLQNIPRPDEQGSALIRSLFVPRPGSVLLSCDYSQIELRVGAMYAQDRDMLDLLAAGGDIHHNTAMLVYGSGGKEERQVGKTLNFLTFYGGTADKLRESLALRGRNISLQQAREYYAAYHAAFPGIQRLANQRMGEVERTGGVTDVFGRFYPVPEKLKYKGVNYLVQGTCAAILKRAIERLGTLLDEIGGCMVSFIHDEIVIDAPASFGRSEIHLIKSAMEKRVPGITVATPVEVAICRTNWARKEAFAEEDA